MHSGKSHEKIFHLDCLLRLLMNPYQIQDNFLSLLQMFQSLQKFQVISTDHLLIQKKLNLFFNPSSIKEKKFSGT